MENISLTSVPFFFRCYYTNKTRISLKFPLVLYEYLPHGVYLKDRPVEHLRDFVCGPSLQPFFQFPRFHYHSLFMFCQRGRYTKNKRVRKCDKKILIDSRRFHRRRSKSLSASYNMMVKNSFRQKKQNCSRKKRF